MSILEYDRRLGRHIDHRFTSSDGLGFHAAFLLLLVLPSSAFAETYFVSSAGTPDGDGSMQKPWDRPSRCVNAMSPLGAGDVCEVGDGTYSSPMYIGSDSPAGSEAAPITIRSQNPFGAKINIPASSTAISISRSHYEIEGFEFSATSANHTQALIGINILDTSGVTIRRNKFHNIGRSVCSNQSVIWAIHTNLSSRLVIEENVFSTIGRLRNGENGCATTATSRDTAIAFVESSDLTVRRNLFYDVNRGYAMSVALPTQNLLFEHNTVVNPTPSQDKPDGCLTLSGDLKTATFRNNLFDGCKTGGSAIDHTVGGFTATDVSVAYNRQSVDDTSGDNMFGDDLPSGVSVSNNTDDAPSGFNDAGNLDFTLSPMSGAIDAGTPTGEPFCGAAPDQGAFELCDMGAGGSGGSGSTAQSVSAASGMSTGGLTASSSAATGGATSGSGSGGASGGAGQAGDDAGCQCGAAGRGSPNLALAIAALLATAAASRRKRPKCAPQY